MTSVARCKSCGAFVQGSDRFCWSCGAELAAAAAPARRPAQAAVAADRETELAIRRAYLAQRRGELEEAERLLREALGRAPESVPALSMLSEVLRAKGDLVGAVAAAQGASEAAERGEAPPGALARAREERARIEEGVVRELTSAGPSERGKPSDLLSPPAGAWYRSRGIYAGLATLGLAGMFMALVALLRGQFVGYAWFVTSIFAAGWCYHDAETRRQGGLFWGPFVLFLGPFGLAVYLLARY